MLNEINVNMGDLSIYARARSTHLIFCFSGFMFSEMSSRESDDDKNHKFSETKWTLCVTDLEMENPKTTPKSTFCGS